MSALVKYSIRALAINILPSRCTSERSPQSTAPSRASEQSPQPQISKGTRRFVEQYDKNLVGITALATAGGTYLFEQLGNYGYRRIGIITAAVTGLWAGANILRESGVNRKMDN